MVSGNIDWVLAVNIVIWTGLFLYLLRLERQVRGRAATRSDEAAERDQSLKAQPVASAEPEGAQASQEGS